METENNSLEKLLERFSDLSKYEVDMQLKPPNPSFIIRDGEEEFVIFISITNFEGNSVTSYAYSYKFPFIDPETKEKRFGGSCGYKHRLLEEVYNQLKTVHKIS